MTGEIVYSDGSREAIDARTLISVPEAALSILWLNEDQLTRLNETERGGYRIGLIGEAEGVVAVALGLVAATMLGPLFLLFVIGGAAIVVLYAFEAPLVHSDVGFALGWGAFPVVTTAFATGAHPVPTALAALAATLLSLAQRRLSTRARSIRRRAVGVSGEIVYADGSREAIDAHALLGAPEGALSLLWIALCAVALAVLLARWF